MSMRVGGGGTTIPIDIGDTLSPPPAPDTSPGYDLSSVPDPKDGGPLAGLDAASLKKIVEKLIDQSLLDGILAELSKEDAVPDEPGAPNTKKPQSLAGGGIDSLTAALTGAGLDGALADEIAGALATGDAAKLEDLLNKVTPDQQQGVGLVLAQYLASMLMQAGSVPMQV